MNKKTEHSNIALLLSGRAISGMGDQFFEYGINAWIAALGVGGQWLMTLFQFSKYTTNLLLNILGGAVSDRVNRRKILIICDTVSAIACIMLALLEPTQAFLYAIVVVNILLATTISFSSPAYRAILPQTVHKDHIGKLNSLLETTARVVDVSAPIIALFIVEHTGITGALFFDGISFFISAILMFFVVVQLEKATINDTNTSPRQSIIKDITEGFHYIVRHKYIVIVLCLSSILNFLFAGFNLILPYANTAFHSQGLYALFLSSEAIGGIIGAVIATAIKRQSYIIMSLFIVPTGLSIASIPLLSTFGSAYVTCSAIVLYQITLTIYNIQFFTVVQTHVEEQYLGRVFGVIFTVATATMPLGILFFSYCINFSSAFNYIIIGVGITAIGIIATIAFNALNATLNTRR